jgi:hypothetical protein
VVENGGPNHDLGLKELVFWQMKLLH